MCAVQYKGNAALAFHRDCSTSTKALMTTELDS
jgi:hypothetical protein